MLPWERRLVAWAHEGLESHAPEASVWNDSRRLRLDYEYCERLTRVHSRTFYLASGLLPAEKRRAVRALYAFCRISDDLVDRAAEDSGASLSAWRQLALDTSPPASDDQPVALAWWDTRTRHRIPVRYAEQLIEGVARDLTPEGMRYASFEDLTTYCYRVASTVGLMSMHIIGFSGVEAIPYAIKLGVALQMTNILRDVGEDQRACRIYLPQDELAKFALSDSDIARGEVDDRWRAFMRFQITRTRELYSEAMPGISFLDPSGRFAIQAAAELYRAILQDIEAHDYDVFGRRAHVGAWGKVRRLPGIWWRAR